MKKLTDEKELIGKTIAWVNNNSTNTLLIIFTDKTIASYNLTRIAHDNDYYFKFNSTSLEEMNLYDLDNLCVITSAPKELWDEKYFTELFNRKRDEYQKELRLKETEQLRKLIDENVEFVKEYIKEK